MLIKVSKSLPQRDEPNRNPERKSHHRVASPEAPRRGGRLPGGDGRPPGDRFRGGGTAFSLGNLDDLVQTMFVGVFVLGVVVAIDKVRRRRRPVRP